MRGAYLLIADTTGTYPLVSEVRENRIAQAKMLLETFAASFQSLDQHNLFRKMFMSADTSIYEMAIANGNTAMCDLLKQYGADYYTVNPILMPVNGLYSYTIKNDPYWQALFTERLKHRFGNDKHQRIAVLHTLQAHPGNQTVVQSTADKQLVSTQLHDLAVYLANEAEFIQRQIDEHPHSFMNRTVRPALRSAEQADARNLNDNYKTALNSLVFGFCLTGFVFWAMYNNTLVKDRRKLAHEIWSNPNNTHCKYSLSYNQDDEPYNYTLFGYKNCVSNPGAFEWDCQEPFFMDDYEPCYDLTIDIIFHTLCMIFAAIFMIIPPVDQFDGLTPATALGQELVKSPVYFARWAVGEQAPLTSIPGNASRIPLYQELIRLLMTHYHEGEVRRELQTQLDALNGGNGGVNVQTLQTALRTIETRYNAYAEEQIAGLGTIQPNQLGPLVQRLQGLTRIKIEDLEKGGALEMRRSTLTTEQSRLLNASPIN